MTHVHDNPTPDSESVLDRLERYEQGWKLPATAAAGHEDSIVIQRKTLRALLDVARAAERLRNADLMWTTDYFPLRQALAPLTTPSEQKEAMEDPEWKMQSC